MKIVVIGAGLTGACCALNLVRAGHAVTLLDSGLSGGGTTSNSGSAILFQTKDTESLIDLTRRSMALWDEFARPGIAPFRRDGSHILFGDAEEEEFAAARAAFLRGQGIDIQRLDRQAVSQHLPNLHPRITGSYYCAVDSEANPYLSTIGIIKAATQNGATLIENDACAQIDVVAGRVRGVRTIAGQTIACDAAVIAAGPATTALAQQLGVTLPVSPERGEQLLTPPMPPTLKGRILSVRYIRGKALGAFAGLALGQEPDGRIKIGSTREPGESALVTSDRGRAALLEELALCLPDLAVLPIERHTVGIRMSSRRPIVAPLPQNAGVFAIDGLGGNGVAFAPLVAEVLAHLIAEKLHPLTASFALG